MAYIGRQNLGGAYRQLDDISSGFDGSDTTHTMQVNSANVTVGDVNQIILSLGGVIQKPGTDFTVSGSVLTFTTAPAANTSFFAILLGSDNGGTVTPTDGSVTGDKLASTVTTSSNITTTGTTSLDGAVTINESSADVDFRVESNANANALHVDGGNSSVGINTTGASDASLQINDTVALIKLLDTDDNTFSRMYHSAGNLLFDADKGDTGSGTYIQFGADDTQVFKMSTTEVVANDASNDQDFRVESNSYASALLVDANENAVFVGTTAFYDTNAIFTVRSGASSAYTQHLSNSSSSFTSTMMYFSSNMEEDTSSFFQKLVDTNDTQISFRLDGNGFFDGAADAGNADFAEYFESTDGSAIAIGKTVVLDSGKVRASTDSDNASDIVGVVRHRKTVGLVGNSAWSKWKGKYKVDDYGVPLLEEHTVTEWDEIVAEDADDLEITYNGEKKKLPQRKGDTIPHSYQTDKIPSELTVPSDAKVLTVDADGNKYKRKILSDSYDASKEYVSREDRDEWNLIGLTGQVTMTKGQKTGDRWIKMRDISDTVEEWLIR